MALSAGILVYRERTGVRELLLGHPGGPFWAKKDLGAWTVFKGAPDPGEDLRAAAVREFREETGLEPPADLVPLEPIRQKGGKTVACWAGEADLDLSRFRSVEIELAWPPRSGRRIRVPEIDRLAYFAPAEALERVLPSQAPLILQALAL